MCWYISKKVVVDVTWDTGVPLHPEHIFVNISKNAPQNNVSALFKSFLKGQSIIILNGIIVQVIVLKLQRLYNEMSRFVPHLCEQTQIATCTLGDGQ